MVLSNEEFAKQVIKSFDDIRKEISKLCDKHNDLEKKIDIHLSVREEIQEYQDNLDKKKDRKFYVVIALMGMAFTIYEVTKGLI